MIDKDDFDVLYSGIKNRKDKKETNEKTIIFTCPNCGIHELGQLQNVLTTYLITSILEGDLDYDDSDPTTGDAIILGHQCINCGYELRDKNGNPVEDVVEVYNAVKYLNEKENCPQEEGYVDPRYLDDNVDK